MRKLSHIAKIVLFVLLTVLNTAFGQGYFRVMDGIPHLPVLDPAAVISPQKGMLVFSSANAEPFIFTGSDWEGLCTSNISGTSTHDFFLVKEGVPLLPALNNAPAGILLPGTIYYSTTSNAVMVFNGGSWLKIAEMSTATIGQSKGFSAGRDANTCKFPVLDKDPVQTGFLPEHFISILIPELLNIMMVTTGNH